MKCGLDTAGTQRNEVWHGLSRNTYSGTIGGLDPAGTLIEARNVAYTLQEHL